MSSVATGHVVLTWFQLFGGYSYFMLVLERLWGVRKIVGKFKSKQFNLADHKVQGMSEAHILGVETGLLTVDCRAQRELTAGLRTSGTRALRKSGLYVHECSKEVDNNMSCFLITGSLYLPCVWGSSRELVLLLLMPASSEGIWLSLCMSLRTATMIIAAFQTTNSIVGRPT